MPFVLAERFVAVVAVVVVEDPTVVVVLVAVPPESELLQVLRRSMKPRRRPVQMVNGYADWCPDLNDFVSEPEKNLFDDTGVRNSVELGRHLEDSVPAVVVAEHADPSDVEDSSGGDRVQSLIRRLRQQVVEGDPAES